MARIRFVYDADNVSVTLLGNGLIPDVDIEDPELLLEELGAATRLLLAQVSK